MGNKDAEDALKKLDGLVDHEMKQVVADMSTTARKTAQDVTAIRKTLGKFHTQGSFYHRLIFSVS